MANTNKLIKDISIYTKPYSAEYNHLLIFWPMKDKSEHAYESDQRFDTNFLDLTVFSTTDTFELVNQKSYKDPVSLHQKHIPGCVQMDLKVFWI